MVITIPLMGYKDLEKLSAIWNAQISADQCNFFDENLFLEAPCTSRKRLHTKVTPDFQLTYSKNGGNLGLVSK